MANARRQAPPYERWRTQRALIPTGNPSVWTTPEVFLHVVNGASISLYYNGQRLRFGSGNDFTVSESGGVGSGYDTVALLFTPHASDTFCADYFVP
jgi:hypothetical protein